MPQTLTNLIVSVRELLGDGTTDNLSRLENLNNRDQGNVIGSGQTLFNLVNYPAVGVEAVQVDGLPIDGGAAAVTTGAITQNPDGTYVVPVTDGAAFRLGAVLAITDAAVVLPVGGTPSTLNGTVMNNPPPGPTDVLVAATASSTPFSIAVGASATQNGWVLLPDTGQISIVPPPQATAYVTYYYYLFPDATWEEFILHSLQRVNLSSGGTVGLVVDVLNVPDGILGPIKLFVGHAFCSRMASQTGTWYNQRLQERVEDRDSISKKYTALAKQYLDDGYRLLQEAYEGFGRQFIPAFVIVQATPRPWTPYR